MNCVHFDRNICFIFKVPVVQERKKEKYNIFLLETWSHTSEDSVLDPKNLNDTSIKQASKKNIWYLEFIQQALEKCHLLVVCVWTD